jgi:hypothetical protein
VAEILSRYYKHEISLHAFDNGTSSAKCKANWLLLKKFFARQRLPVSDDLINAVAHSEADAAIPVINLLYSILTGKQVASPFNSTNASSSQLFTMTSPSLSAASGGYHLQASAAHQGPSFAAPTASHAIAARLNKADARDTADLNSLSRRAAEAAAEHTRATQTQAAVTRQQALPVYVSRLHTLRRAGGPRAVPADAPAASPLAFSTVTVKTLKEDELSQELATTLAVSTGAFGPATGALGSQTDPTPAASGAAAGAGVGGAGAAAAPAASAVCFGAGGRPSSPDALAAALFQPRFLRIVPAAAQTADAAAAAAALLTSAFTTAVAPATAAPAAATAAAAAAAADSLAGIWPAVIGAVAAAAAAADAPAAASSSDSAGYLSAVAAFVAATAPAYSPTPLAAAAAAAATAAAVGAPSVTLSYLLGSTVSQSPKQLWLLAKAYLRLFAVAPARSPLCDALAMALAACAESLWASGEAPAVVADAYADFVAPALFLVLRSAPDKTAPAALITAAFHSSPAELFARLPAAAAPKPGAPLDDDGEYLLFQLLAHALAVSPAVIGSGAGSNAAAVAAWPLALALAAPVIERHGRNAAAATAAGAGASAGAGAGAGGAESGTAAAAVSLLAAAAAPFVAAAVAPGSASTVSAARQAAQALDSLLPRVLARATGLLESVHAAHAAAAAAGIEDEDVQLALSDAMAYAVAAVRLCAAALSAFGSAEGQVTVSKLVGHVTQLLHAADAAGYSVVVEASLVRLLADPARVAAAARAPLARFPALTARAGPTGAAAAVAAAAAGGRSPFDAAPAVRPLVLSRLGLFSPAAGSTSAGAGAGQDCEDAGALVELMLARTAPVMLQEGGVEEPPLATAWQPAAVLRALTPQLARERALTVAQTAVLRALFEGLLPAVTGAPAPADCGPWAEALTQLHVRLAI